MQLIGNNSQRFSGRDRLRRLLGGETGAFAAKIRVQSGLIGAIFGAKGTRLNPVPRFSIDHKVSVIDSYLD